MAMDFLKNLGVGAKTPSKSQGGAQNFGAFLRYMVDDEQKTMDKKAQTIPNIVPQMGGLPLNKIYYKDGVPIPVYEQPKQATGAGEDDISALFQKNDEETKSNPISDYFKKWFGGDEEKEESSTQAPQMPPSKAPGMVSTNPQATTGQKYSVGQLIEKAGDKWKVVGFDTDGTPFMEKV